MSPTRPGIKRFTVELSPQTHTLMKLLKKRTNASSLAEVIRNALKVYEQSTRDN